jgi:hypothetical protein
MEQIWDRQEVSSKSNQEDLGALVVMILAE